MRDAGARWTVAVVCCVNQRPEGARRASCGSDAGREIRRRLRDRLRELGLHDEVLVTTSGCLDVCPARGSTVALVANGAPARLVIVDPDEPADGLLDLITGCLDPSDG